MWRPRTSDDHCVKDAPSKHIFPCVGCQYPTSIRAREDLPDALGPITPRALPLCNLRDRSRTTGFSAPGGTTLAFSTTIVLCGGGNGIGSTCDGSAAKSRLSRSQLCRAETQPRQWAIAISMGASARALRIEPAMMIPADAC